MAVSAVRHQKVARTNLAPTGKAPSLAEIKAVIIKSYDGPDTWQFPQKLALKAVPRALVGSTLAKDFARFQSGKNDTYDYSSLYQLNIRGHAVYALESVTDAVDDLRVYSSKGRQIISANETNSWPTPSAG
jgi:hypothetical protein